jgi:S-adenosylmethionine:tRNA-ribosyltransferase-isomerase (queuine synthetase)
VIAVGTTDVRALEAVSRGGVSCSPNQMVAIAIDWKWPGSLW